MPGEPVAPLLSRSVGCAGGDRSACRAGDRPGRERGAAPRVRRHVQFSPARHAADPGGPAARQRPRHPHLPRGPHDRGHDGRRRPRDGHEPELPGAERAPAPACTPPTRRTGSGDEKEGTVSAFADRPGGREAEAAQHGPLRRGRPDLREPAPVGEVPAGGQLLRRLGRGAAGPRRREAGRPDGRQGGRGEGRPDEGDQRPEGELRRSAGTTGPTPT